MGSYRDGCADLRLAQAAEADRLEKEHDALQAHCEASERCLRYGASALGYRSDGRSDCMSPERIVPPDRAPGWLGHYLDRDVALSHRRR